MYKQYEISRQTKPKYPSFISGLKKENLLRLVGVEMSLPAESRLIWLSLGIMLIMVNLHSQSRDMNITGLIAAPNLNNSCNLSSYCVIML